MNAGDSPRNRTTAATRPRLSGEAEDRRLAALAADLFGRVSREDLEGYAPEAIAAFVASAGTLLAERIPGRHLIRLSDAPAGVGGPRGVTLVEILNDNMPFLVDSVMAEIQDFGAEVRLVAHPIVTVERDRSGRLTAYHGTAPAKPPAIRESLVQIHIDRLMLTGDRDALAGRLDQVLTDVRRAVEDWQKMLGRVRDAIAAYQSAPPPVGKAELAEAVAFLEWLAAGNFTFLGLREYDFVGGAKSGELRRAGAAPLGILRDPAVRVLRRGAEAFTTTPAIREFLMRPEPLIIAKANVRSRVHRRVYLDYIGVKLYRAEGRLAGELRFVGLLTSNAYTSPAREIPYLRQKVARILARAGFEPDSHSGKALVNVLDSYPRDELFQIDDDRLFDFATAILALEERPRVRVLVRRDKFDRYASVIVFVPRDRYDSQVRAQIGDYLAAAFDGHVSAFYPAFPEGALTRVHFIIGRTGGPTPDPDRRMLEEGVTRIVRSWADGLAEALLARHDAGRAAALIARYRDAFSAAYTDDFAPEDAVADIDAFERLSVNRPIAGEFLPGEAGHPPVTLKLIHLGAPIALSKRVPMLENMGFRVIDERSYEITPADGHAPIILHDMALERADGKAIGLDRLAPLLVAAFMAVWFGHAESDGYNALVLEAGLAWRDIALIRSVSRYLRQAGQPYSQSYMWETLNRHPAIARIIVELFHARFAPGGKEASAKSWMAKIEAGLEAVKSLDEDRIIRAFVNAVSAMVRTNFFQLARDGTPHDEISFKLDSTMIDGLPAPKPFREVFVYSPRVEGIHLRFGRIARGGIRWSDRPQDFRTEILGLVKAQQVKNAVIVPVGAKGGFIPKHLPVGGSRDAVLAEGTAAYRIFIATLLDITDNLDGDTVVPPDGVERREGDDPYFVVAADKGTATFSDTANAIALARGFWLGDAFASGGSAGYDHKAMGITARGAWEAVKRHFREIDRDIQATPFTAVGVGDMSGDVFGNAMLLSPATKLVAAFDHRDIFVDPDPDPAAGLEERKQLFGLPRSSWQDYDRRKISAGGGVFARAEKFIKLSREMKALLDLPGATATPQEIILRILKAKVDLLFFGGIGTFVRGPAESDDRVGDRANDAVRVTALDIRARVIGEGANLGMTQQARIAFNLAGGRCNSDAIDNSAGVNTSDVEVNIKIALGQAVRAGRLDLKRRNRLLAAMTGEVAALVLRNNYLQTLAISLAERRGFEDFAFQQRMMQGLESRGLLDRKVETLPDDAAMAERQAAGKPLTRAEIGVLLAYAKIALSADLLEGDVAGDPFLAGELVRYFPKRMQKDYRAEIEGHRLRREIIATMTSNAMINRGGPTYLTRVADRTGAGPIDIARAFVAVRDAFGLRDLNGAIDGLDGKIPGAVQLGLYRAVEDLLVAKTVWFLRHASFAAGIGPVIAAYGKSVAALGALLDKALPAHLGTHIAAEAARLAAAGVPGPLARRIARLPGLADAADIHLVAEAAGCPLARAAEIFFAIAEEFRIGRIEARAGGLPLADYFDGLALDRALETLADAHRRLAIDVLGRGGDGEPLTAWRGAREAALERTMRTVTAMVESEELTVSRVTVAANLLSDLARGQDRPAKGGAF